jgi:hypothetical protein
MALIGLVAMMVLTLAGPYLMANLRYLPVELALQRYYATDEIPSERLPVLIRFSQQSIAWNDHYRFHDGLSRLHWLRAQDVNTPALERRPAYISSMEEAEASLARAPAQTATWLLLANLRWLLHEEAELVVDAWKMSIFTGRTAVTYTHQRVAIGLAYLGYLDQEGVAMLRDQLLLAWRGRPGSLVQVLSMRDRNLELTRRLIENSDPIALAEMEAWLEKLP